mmetsp:Transcript_4523/g.9023  ORF Transcript_4523/g.9023 Transcript_4523/m.9023 type:complete len:266 (-) Transcript_4523:1102-1899(-)
MRNVCFGIPRSRAKSDLPRHYTKQTFVVVIPTLNEAATVKDAVASTSESFESSGGDQLEVIVVDGGSSDETVLLAEESGASILRNGRGRAIQMNHGARVAGSKEGTILVFQHADSRLPPKFNRIAAEILAKPGVVAGAFPLKLESSSTGLLFRLGISAVQYFANVRSRFFQLPFGDQSMFLTNESFERVGGFPEVPFMEDFEMSRILRRAGKIVLAPAQYPSRSSARRWETHGILRTTLLNQFIITARMMGVSLDVLGTWYRRLR